jgi:thiol:disulfide interchange protein
MNRSMVLLVVGILLGNASGFTREKLQEEATYVPVTKFDPNRDAEKDIRNAVIEAGRTGRRILLDVGGDWCVWCRRLDSLLAANRDLAESLHKGFVVVKVNWSRENKNEAVLSHYPKIPGYPHLFVLDSKGKLLHSQDTGQLESGNHHDREKVLAFLKKWSP